MFHVKSVVVRRENLNEQASASLQDLIMSNIFYADKDAQLKRRTIYLFLLSRLETMIANAVL